MRFPSQLGIFSMFFNFIKKFPMKIPYSPTSFFQFLLVVIILHIAIAFFSPHQAGAVVIDAFGDSITVGVPYYRATDGNGCSPPCGGYEPELQRLLNSAGWNATIRNYGRRGEATNDGLERFDAVIAASHPNFTLLLEGTNDLLFISPYTLRSNIAAMVDKSLARRIVPVVGTITPDFNNSYKLIDLANTLLSEMATKKGVPLADLHGATASKWSSYNYDGIHPNQTGYSIIAHTWYNALILWEVQQRGKAAGFLPAIYHLLLSD